MAKGRKTGGRRPGSLNKATIEAKAACAELVDDPDYRRRLGQRLRAGTLSLAVECMLWYYAKGMSMKKPSKPHTQTTKDGFEIPIAMVQRAPFVSLLLRSTFR